MKQKLIAVKKCRVLSTLDCKWREKRASLNSQKRPISKRRMYEPSGLHAVVPISDIWNATPTCCEPDHHRLPSPEYWHNISVHPTPTTVEALMVSQSTAKLSTCHNKLKDVEPAAS
jgi:hypothetical protein